MKRGVCVRLLLPGPHTDIPSVRYAGRHDYHDLLEAGVEIYEYQRSRLHAKTLVVDGKWASVGSSNLTNRSFSWNYESNVHVFDAAFAAEMERMFERDLVESRQITLAEWKQRSFGQRFLEWMYACSGRSTDRTRPPPGRTRQLFPAFATALGGSYSSKGPSVFRVLSR